MGLHLYLSLYIDFISLYLSALPFPDCPPARKSSLSLSFSLIRSHFHCFISLSLTLYLAPFRLLMFLSGTETT